MNADSYIHTAHKGAPDGPLLFVFHGTGGDEHQLVPLGRELLPQAMIVSPRGDVSEHGSARFFRRTGEGVYDMDDLARATQRMSAFVEAQRAEFEGRPVYGLGYSNGANILATVLFANPNLFNAAVLMHPLIPFEPDIQGDLAGLKILITAGRRDPICPPNLTMRLDGYLRAGSADVTLEWHEGGHEIRSNEIETATKFLRAG